ncbi:LytTR family DNA-binding domain-containing protein [Streptococcus dentasini]
MKIRVELDKRLETLEVVLKTPNLSGKIDEICRLLSCMDRAPFPLYKGTSEYFIDLAELLFFETEGANIYAHTKEDAYRVKMRLYELEDRLPAYFCRISKSAIVNVQTIYSLDKSFSGTSTIRFEGTHKQIHVSRHYYQYLKNKLNEMR